MERSIRDLVSKGQLGSSFLELKFRGKAWKFGSNIDTDVIISACYLTSYDPKELAAHCMEAVDPAFSKNCLPGDILVADWNFGCGSSREHAPIAIMGAGVSCVVAKSFARIFYRNAFNTGLPLVEAPGNVVDRIQTGGFVEVDLQKGILTLGGTGESFPLQRIPEFMRDLLAAGGLVPYVRNRLFQKGRTCPS